MKLNIDQAKATAISSRNVSASNERLKDIGNQIWGSCIFLAIVGSLSANPWESAAGAMVPAILFHLLWRTGETPILLFCTMFQWLQAFAPVIMANLKGATLDAVFGGPQLRAAAWLSFIGIVVLAAGMHLVLRKQPRLTHELDHYARRLNPLRLVLAYLAIWAISTAFEFALHFVPQLHSVGSSIILIKWIPLYLLAYRVVITGKRIQLLMVPVGIEIVVGMTGYFSSFKSVLFLLLVVSIGVLVRTSRIPWFRVAAVVVPTIVLVVIWQGVKNEQRRFISGNTRQQAVVVDFTDRVNNLKQLIMQLDIRSLRDAAASGLKRIGYLDYFAYSICNVPAVVPHENGGLWLAAMQHVLMPRVFFPNKPPINDSERTNRYTLQRVAGASEGTSVSIGYMGESYIDFGIYGMFVPIFLLGAMYGQIFRWFLRHAPNPLIGFAFATAVLLFSANLLESSNIKIFGGIVTDCIVFAVLIKFGGQHFWNCVCDLPIKRAQLAKGDGASQVHSSTLDV
jgi:hypothetical protein